MPYSKQFKFTFSVQSWYFILNVKEVSLHTGAQKKHELGRKSL